MSFTPKSFARLAVIFIVGFILLAVIVATEENWRGKRAWENCKRELEAKGVVLDWNTYIPPTVPDDQNFFKVPKMAEWFVKNEQQAFTNELTQRFNNADTTATITNETAAIKYLAWSDQLQPEFEEIREALKRPYARMDADYSKPFGRQMPNFVAVRSIAQILAQRTKCLLLLGQPEKALRELTMMQDSCHILDFGSKGKPMYLISSMINVAVTGLYVDTIANGLQSHSWREPQLAALQAQLQAIDLTDLVADSLRVEQAGACRLLETMYEHKPSVAFPSESSWWQNLNNPVFWVERIAPRGFLYQNMAAITSLEQKPIDALHSTDHVISPRKLDEANDVVEKSLNHFSPYTLIAAIAVPNFIKAIITTVKNQSLVNQAQIVCALERYHLANGNYPDTLAALMPQFIKKLPHDLIGGQPLHYRRTDDGKFLLYSVGWNETDDGGLPGTLADVKKGDWVWAYPVK